MKKWLLTVLAMALLSGVYGLTIGLSAAYQDITDEEGGGAYFGAKADAILGLLPIFKARCFLAEIDFKENTPMSLGTFTGTDLLIMLPLPVPVQPYVVAGVWFVKDFHFTIKGGIGGEVGFGNMTGYLEGNLELIKPDQGSSYMPINIMGGLRFPLKLGF
ncbi:MAG: hypothetical protein N3A65_01065 [candidate division WOR-3 bacterium]|nr:hypothetical protein [candidate division WOR-3 bacterium]